MGLIWVENERRNKIRVATCVRQATVDPYAVTSAPAIVISKDLKVDVFAVDVSRICLIDGYIASVATENVICLTISKHGLSAVILQSTNDTAR